MSIAKPHIAIARTEELFRDHIGQLWSPAAISVTWPPSNGLRAPSIEVNVIAPASPEMTLAELNHIHLQAAQDVLNAALLSLEQMLTSRNAVPTLWPNVAE